MLVNLAANAARHTDSGSIVLAARPNGRHELAIELRDTGSGISREHRERIFDRFYRGGDRDGDGFGLGLAIVRASVQALGGSVEIESEPDSGTTARVVILSAVSRTDRTEHGEDPAGRGRGRDPRRGQLRAAPGRLRGRGRRRRRARARARARGARFDVVLLDVMLPRLSGTEVCRTLRAESDVPIIMLTARDAEVDRVLGLELGADDYVTKPFSIAELKSRVRALLRRRELDRAATGAAVQQIGGLRIDFARHEVVVDGITTVLTPSEFKLLALLAGEPERVFNRNQIMEHLWQSTYVGDDRAADVHVSNLRRKIERDPAHPERVVTVRGVGYKLRVQRRVSRARGRAAGGS